MMKHREHVQELQRFYDVMIAHLNAWKQTEPGTPQERLAWRRFMRAKLVYWAAVSDPPESDEELDRLLGMT